MDGAAKPCDLPVNATQLGTNANGEIVAISTATSEATTVCYISPDNRYWETKGEIKIETIVDKFLGDVTTRYVSVGGKKHYVGDDSNMENQIAAEATNRKKFPLHSLTNASEFINKFRITTRGQNFEIRCDEGIYLYTNLQYISHPDVHGGGASRIRIVGSADDNWSGYNKPFTFGTPDLVVEGYDEESASIENSDGRNVAYKVTFMTPRRDSYPGFAKINGIVEFSLCNFTFGGYSLNATDYYADIITYENYVGKMQSPFITVDSDDGSEIIFNSVWLNTGLYACYNVSCLKFGSESLDSDYTSRTIGNIPNYLYPIQVNSVMVTPVFGAYKKITIPPNTYLRVIAQHGINNPDHTGTSFQPVFAMQQGCKFHIGRSKSSPTRIEVSCTNLYEDLNDNGQAKSVAYRMLCFVLAQSGSSFVYDLDSVSTNPSIINNVDSVAIYWYAKCVDRSGDPTLRKMIGSAYENWTINDCIPIFMTSDAMRVGYAVWTDNQHANLNGFFNDGRVMFNRWIHFKSFLSDSGVITDLSDDFDSDGTRIQDNGGVVGGGHFEGDVFIHNPTNNF